MSNKSERLFLMKEFSIKHELSANKVGVDGVLIGAWADIPESTGRILDAGTGCGLIALMIAQRSANPVITAIDIDEGAHLESAENFSKSSWADRLHSELMDFINLKEEVENKRREKFDMIISNPPFFNSGITEVADSRTLARQAGTLSPSSLIKNAPSILNPGGQLSLIATFDSYHELKKEADDNNMQLKKLCIIKGNPSVKPKRILLTFILSEHSIANPQKEIMIIEKSPGCYTDEYRKLCAPFYLKF